MTIHVVRAGIASTVFNWPNGAYETTPYKTSYNLDDVSGLDTGAEFNNATGVWTPQAGPISWCAQIWASAFGGINQNFCLTMFKNGVDFQAALPSAPASGDVFAGTCNTRCMGFDVANGTDVYQMMMYMTTYDGTSSGALDGDPRHCWFNGISFGG
jgi:hypothetical protein